MKNRLQALWDDTVPIGGACPRPEPEAVLRRVNAALDGSPQVRKRRRLLKNALILAALLLLMAAAALAVGQIPLPAGNVLETNFRDGGNNDVVAGEVDVEPASVSDENFTMTVTSSIADHGKVYLNLFIEPKNEEAIALCESQGGEDGVISLIRFRHSWVSGGSSTISRPYDRERGGWDINVAMQMGFGLWKTLAIRFDCMEDGLWLKMPVRQMKPLELKIDATGPGKGTYCCPDGGPVTLEQVKLSPLSIWLKYRTPSDQQGSPVAYFLWKDGTLSTFRDLGIHGFSGSGAYRKEYYTAKEDYKFGSVQDITKMEAIVFAGMAYPLDGGAPYAVDTSSLPPFPFAVPVRLEGGDTETIPFFALCEGLGVSCEWDETARTAAATYRDVTLTYTEGIPSVKVERTGAAPEDAELDVPPVFLEGEFWVDLSILWSGWEISGEGSFVEASPQHETGSYSDDLAQYVIIP